ncbi:MAG TPA: integrase arm-type DNA-binding domain-containing protein, partial [Methylocella sp.]
MARLTDKKVAEIKPRKVAREIREGSIGGLFLAVQTSGTKSWVLRFRIDGRSRKMTLGSFPALTAAAAREAAKEALELIKNGVDPIAAKMETKAAGDGPKTTARNVVPDKIEDVVHAFVANHVRRKKRPMKPASQRTAERHLTKLLAAFPGRRLSSLKLAEVKKSLIDPLAEIGKGISANRAVSTLTSLINFARKNDFIKDNPLLGLERPVVEESRDRVLTDVELATVMTAARKVGYPFGDIVQILALTGQRRGEATQMQWPELDLENGRWELSKERTKNKKPHTVMLSAAVVAILKNVKRGDAGNFVFS